MRWIVPLFILLSFKTFAAGGPFVINGVYNPVTESLCVYFFVPATAGNPPLLQHTQLADGKFLFSGNSGSGAPVIARLYFDSSARLTAAQLLKRTGYYEFVLDTKLNVTIDGNKRQFSVTGSLVNDDFTKLRSIERKYNVVDSRSQINSLAYYSQLAEFASERPQSQFLPLVRSRILRMPLSWRNRLIPELSRMLATSDSLFLATSAARQMKLDISRSASLLKYTSGTLLPDYVFKDGSDTVSISQYRGKYLLVYFWASWSNESVRYQKLLENAFIQYPTKRFSILQVSMDPDIGSWKQFFTERKVLWKQARLVKGWDEKVQGAFDIHGLPCTYMLDPDGKIIGKDLSIQALVEILRKLPS